MINNEVAGVLLAASKNIARWTKQADKPEGKRTFASKRAHEAAWRTTAYLIPVLEHAKESDHYWKLVETAPAVKKTPREQQRLFAIAKQEDREFIRAKLELEKVIEQCVTKENADPRADADKAEAARSAALVVAAAVRHAEEKAGEKDYKRAKTSKEKAAAQARHETAWAAFNVARAAADTEMHAVLKKLGLVTPEMDLLRKRTQAEAKALTTRAPTKKAPAKKPIAIAQQAPAIVKKKVAR